MLLCQYTLNVRHLNGKTLLYKLQWRHLIPALNVWAARAYYTTARPITTQCSRHGGIDDLTTERSFDVQATWVIYAFGLSFWHVSHGCLCIQALPKAPGRLVQELKVCTVDVLEVEGGILQSLAWNCNLILAPDAEIHHSMKLTVIICFPMMIQQHPRTCKAYPCPTWQRFQSFKNATKTRISI